MASHQLTASVSAELQSGSTPSYYNNNNYYDHHQSQLTGMHSYDEQGRPRRTSPVSSAGQAAHGVVSSSTSGREDQSPIPQCSSSSYSCHTFGGKSTKN